MKYLLRQFLVIVTFLTLLGCGASNVAPLIDASLKNDPDTVKAQLDKGADVNLKGQDGVTALIAASLMGHQDVVKVLLAKGADVNARTNNGEAALSLAARYGP